MILGILQARMTSTRLPGKVMMSILGKPMFIRQIERIKRSKRIDRLILATSTDESDDIIEKVAKEYGIECYRGSLDDVLDRFYQVAKAYKPEHVVRLTADCPLTDWEVIDQIIDKHLKENNDYTSNTIEPTFPDGLDAEILNFKALEEAWKKGEKISDRDNVTIYVYRRPEQFKLGSIKNNVDLSKLRWTVDEPEDFELIEKIYNSLYPENNSFLTQDILDLIAENPELESINSKFERNEGLKKCIENDGIFKSKEN